MFEINTEVEISEPFASFTERTSLRRDSTKMLNDIFCSGNSSDFDKYRLNFLIRDGSGQSIQELMTFAFQRQS